MREKEKNTPVDNLWITLWITPVCHFDLVDNMCITPVCRICSVDNFMHRLWITFSMTGVKILPCG